MESYSGGGTCSRQKNRGMQLNPRKNVPERLLRITTRLRPAEGRSVVLFFSYAFLLLLCYYVLKTIREPLLLGTAATAEIKSYAYATTALVLVEPTSTPR